MASPPPPSSSLLAPTPLASSASSSSNSLAPTAAGASSSSSNNNSGNSNIASNNAPRSTRSRPGVSPVPDGVLVGADGSPSANALAHLAYTQSLAGLSKKERGWSAARRRTQSGGSATREPVDQAVKDEAAEDQQRQGQSGSAELSRIAQSVPPEASSSRSAVDEQRANEKMDGDEPPATTTTRGAGGRSTTAVSSASATAQVKREVKHTDDDEDDEPEVDREDEGGDDDEDDDDEEEGADLTRCVCGITESDDMMIQCDRCNVWQHGACVGIPTEKETPDEYFCEKCRPDLHVALKKWIKSRGRSGIFLPPSALDLQRLKPPDDPTPPNQSKRWTQHIAGLPSLIEDESDSDDGKGAAAAARRKRSRSSRSKTSAAPTGSSFSAKDASTAGAGGAGAAVAGAGGSVRPLAFPPRKKTDGGSGGAVGAIGAGGVSKSSLSASAHTAGGTGSSLSTAGGGSKSHHKRQSSVTASGGGGAGGGGGAATSSLTLQTRPLSPPPQSGSSVSPPRPGAGGAANPAIARAKSPKRRSTMNSRDADAGLEEAIRASLLASGASVPPVVAGTSTTGGSKPNSARRRSPSIASSAGARERDRDGSVAAHGSSSTTGSKRGRRNSIESSTAGQRKGKKVKREEKDVSTLRSPSPTLASSRSAPRKSGGGSASAIVPGSGTAVASAIPSTSAPRTSQQAKHRRPNSVGGGPRSSAGGSTKAGSGSTPTSSAFPSNAGLPSGSPKPDAKGKARADAPGTSSGGRNGLSNTSAGAAAQNGSNYQPRSPRPLHAAVSALSSSTGSSNLAFSPSSWSLPDHLSHLAHLLPTPTPQPLRVPSGGFGAPIRDEPPTKIKWPGRRMTVGEMRKRVRGIMEFITRWPDGGESDLPGAEEADRLCTVRSGRTRAEEKEELMRALIEFDTRFGTPNGIRLGEGYGGNGAGANSSAENGEGTTESH